MAKWELVIDIIQDVRGSVAMYMFIIEEAIQTIGMACYQAKQAKDYDLMRELARYAIDNLVNPAIEFVDIYGVLAYPLNMAYKEFYLAAKKTFETYLTLEEK